MFLTRQELEDLTGYQRATFMIRKLKEYGVRFFIAADGYPRVIKSDLEGEKYEPEEEPNLQFLENMR